MTGSTDVAIIGAGPCGLAAAIAVQVARLSAVVFDESCLVSSIAGFPPYMTLFSTAERLAIGGLPFVTASEKPTRRDALAYYRTAVSHFDLDVRQYERVESVERKGGSFVLTSRTRGGTSSSIEAGAIVVATGYFDKPNLLNVPGEKFSHVSHHYLEGHQAFQRSVIVVGGRNSAAEAALDLYRAGAHVTIVYRGPSLGSGIKPWVLPDLVNRIAEGRIATRWSSHVRAIEAEEIVLETPTGEERLRADHVYLMTGFTPDYTLLRSLGVSVDDATGIPAHDRATMESDVPGVFLAGVLAAGHDANKIFIENGREHGEMIARRLARGR